MRKGYKKGRFIVCPVCESKSKKLYQEMGGLQTRLCHQGHEFEYDKWLADRSIWRFVK